jgi:hypothetical protein
VSQSASASCLARSPNAKRAQVSAPSTKHNCDAGTRGCSSALRVNYEEPQGAPARGRSRCQMRCKTLTETVRAEYRDNTGRALAAGVFGLPFYAFAGELFWGQDRLDMLEGASQSLSTPSRKLRRPRTRALAMALKRGSGDLRRAFVRAGVGLRCVAPQSARQVSTRANPSFPITPERQGFAPPTEVDRVLCFRSR